MVPDNVTIIANAILPVDESIRKNTGENNRINNLNIAIKSLCENYKNVHFLTFTEQLVDLEYNLSDSYHIGEGIHLNTKGYEIWIRELKKALQNIKPSPQNHLTSESLNTSL
jgi:lysophospholipase L1-like esterase